MAVNEASLARRAGTLGERGQRLMDLHAMSVGPTKPVMDVALHLLEYIQGRRLVAPGLFPNMDDIGGLCLEWAIRVDNGDFDIVSVDISRSCIISTSYIPAGEFAMRHDDRVPVVKAEQFISARIPEDDMPSDDDGL